MPIPKPKKGERQKDYISRCIKFQYDEKDNGKKDKKQIAAICYSTWRDNKGTNENVQTMINNYLNEDGMTTSDIKDTMDPAQPKFKTKDVLKKYLRRRKFLNKDKKNGKSGSRTK